MSLARRLTMRNILIFLSAPRISMMKLRTRGMLNPKTYKALYEEVRALPDLPFVEVGAASGAGTISIGWAFADSGKRAKILSVEKCEGGSRTRYGGYSDN